MRSTRLLAAVFGLATLVGARGAAQGNTPADARRMIDAANAASILGFNSGQPRALSDLYASNAMLMMAGAPPIIGAKKIAGYYDGAYKAGVRNLRSVTTDLIVRDDVAVETGTYTLEVVAKGGGVPMRDSGKFVMVWQRNAAGKWLIIRDSPTSNGPGK